MSLDSSNFFEILDKLNAGVVKQPSLDDNLDEEIVVLNKKIQKFDKKNDIGQIMSAQTDMSEIMNQEKIYLKQREEQIQKDVETGERTMMLNDSTRKKYYAYITIVIVWVAVIIVILVLFYLSRIFGLPFNFLFALIMAVALFWTGWMLYQYSLRDPTDFDKLNLNRPFTGPGFKNPTNVNSSFLGSFGICIGDSCCPSGDVNSNVVYDKNNNRCVLKSSLNTTSSITTPFQGGSSSITAPFQGGSSSITAPFQGGGSSITTPFQGSAQGSVPEQGPGSGPSGYGPSGSGPSGSGPDKLTNIGRNDRMTLYKTPENDLYATIADSSLIPLTFGNNLIEPFDNTNTNIGIYYDNILSIDYFDYPGQDKRIVALIVNDDNNYVLNIGTVDFNDGTKIFVAGNIFAIDTYADSIWTDDKSERFLQSINSQIIVKQSWLDKKIALHDNPVSSLGPSGFQNMNESFMTMGQLLSFYPPQIPMSLVQPYKYNYACESEQLYCNPKIDR